ncbi:MAG TPA: pyridoxal-phosphate dependent enzyme [Phycisphaerales bacterium]|nr:pyridoxal-phosphate dependent enzyme [Phycisphaerales bacterium]
MPSPEGMFGSYGGAFVPEAAKGPLQQLDAAYARAASDAGFWDELLVHLRTLAGRATPLYEAAGLTAQARSRLPKGEGARIWLKREDLAYPGSAAINHAAGFALFAASSGRKRLIAVSGGGPHAVAVATAAAHFGLEAQVLCPADEARISDVARARFLGAKVSEVGDRTAALTGAMEEWLRNPGGAMLVPSGAVGPHPFPAMVRDFQSILGRETKAQSLRNLTKLPDVIVSCVGVGAEAAGLFYPFVDDTGVKLVGVEAGGKSGAPGDHAAPLSMGRRETVLGQTTYALSMEGGMTLPVSSISKAMEYHFAPPEHAYWKDLGRVKYTVAGDDEAIHALTLLARTEGIIASIEAGHGLAEALRLAGEMKADQNIVVNLIGRGDKDVELVSKLSNRA